VIFLYKVSMNNQVQ